MRKKLVFGVILVRIFPHLDWIFSQNAGNADQNKSEYVHFLRSVMLLKYRQNQVK